MRVVEEQQRLARLGVAQLDAIGKAWLLVGGRLLTTANPEVSRDTALSERLGVVPMPMPIKEAVPA